MDLETALDFVRPRRQGVLVTLRGDGRPQSSNIVYALGADGLIRVSVTAGRAKTRNVARDPRVVLHVNADDFWAYAVIDGVAELSTVAQSPNDDTVEELVSLYRALQGEHRDWDEYRAAMVSDQRLVMRIRPNDAYGMVPRVT